MAVLWTTFAIQSGRTGAQIGGRCAWQRHAADRHRKWVPVVTPAAGVLRTNFGGTVPMISHYGRSRTF